jgi:dTDP-4-amino-4,6-dideoxygalactose transaminase
MVGAREADAPRHQVPFIAPVFPPPTDVADDYRVIVASNRYTNFGPFEKRFRSALAAYVGPEAYAVTFSSATTALQAAILGCISGPPAGRYILLPSFTFAAAAQTVAMLGFRPLFVDIEPDSLQADADHARQLIDQHRSEVAGLLFANAFGIGAARISEWDDLARRNDLVMVVDSAAGFGSRYEDGSPLGLHGRCEAFSLHATKPLAIGEGGALITRDPALAEHLMRISNFGFDGSGEPASAGLNGKLAELPSAIGLRQLANLDSVIERRLKILAAYQRVVTAVTYPRNIQRSSLAFVSVLVAPGVDRSRIIDDLSRTGIEARRYYAPPLHRSGVFANADTQLPITEDVSKRVLSLPCHDGVTEDVIEQIAAIVSDAAG